MARWQGRAFWVSPALRRHQLLLLSVVPPASPLIFSAFDLLISGQGLPAKGIPVFQPPPRKGKGLSSLHAPAPPSFPPLLCGVTQVLRSGNTQVHLRWLGVESGLGKKRK